MLLELDEYNGEELKDIFIKMAEKKQYTVIAEYIWLGGKGELRSKTKIFSCDNFVDADQYHIDNYYQR